MSWSVLFHDDFAAEFAALTEPLQDELLAHALLLRDFGPSLGRPTVDTLKGSKHANMKEMRFDGHLDTLKTSYKEHRHGKKT